MTNPEVVKSEKVTEIVPGVLKRRPVVEPPKPPVCRRPHKDDPDPCCDIEVERELFRPSAGTETVHIPGCMGCAVYGHESCTCLAALR